MYASDIMTSPVHTTSIDHTFAEVAGVLHEHSVASVIVMDGETVAGIVTERDLVNIVSDGLDPAKTPLADRLTRELVTIEPRTDISDAAAIMAERKIRHLPVLDGTSLVGIVSIRDLWRWALEEFTAGHELPDLQRAHHALHAAASVRGSTT